MSEPRPPDSSAMSHFQRRLVQRNSGLPAALARDREPRSPSTAHSLRRGLQPVAATSWSFDGTYHSLQSLTRVASFTLAMGNSQKPKERSRIAASLPNEVPESGCPSL